MTSERDPNSGSAGEHQNPVVYSKDSGIRERHGRIPPWLLAVAVILLVWGIYYLVTFWSPPPS